MQVLVEVLTPVLEEAWRLREPAPEMEQQPVVQEKPVWRPWAWVEVEQRAATFLTAIEPVGACLQKARPWSPQKVEDSATVAEEL